MSREFGDLSIEEGANVTVKKFEKLLLESAFTDTFLNKVVVVYRLKTHREALSCLWSNDLKEVINHMAKFYLSEYKRRKKYYRSIRKTKYIGMYR